MNVIKAKRGVAKGRLTKASDFASTVDINTPLSMLQVRFDKLEEAWADFISLQDAMYLHIDEADFVDPELEFYEYEAKYFVAHSVFTSFIKVKQTSDPADKSVAEKLAVQQTAFLEKLNSTPAKASVYLPKIVMSTFSGEYEQWPSFKDMFISSVDQNPSLTPTQKFYYLKSFLSSTAADLVSHMKLTDSNYFEAWDRLEKRFDRSQLIVNAYINSFLSLTSMNSSNVALLRKITDGADEAIRGLNALNTNGRDPWVIYLLVQKLDPDSKQAWAEHLGSKEGATIDELLEFLQNRCACLESCSAPIRPSKPKNKTQGSIRSHVVESVQSCLECKGNHGLHTCKKFLARDVDARRNFARENSLCFNCLRQGHSANRCFLHQRCKICKSRHHVLVHQDVAAIVPASHTSLNLNQSPVAPVTSSSSTSSSNPAPSSVVNHHSSESSCSSHTILPTAVVRTQDREKSFHNLRVLLDTGSQSSFITEQAVQRLGLHRSQSRIPVFGMASTSAGVTNGTVSIRLTSRFSSKFVDVDCHILSKLTSLLPQYSIDSIDMGNLVSFELADPYFNKPGHIDVLIGVDKVFSIISGPPTEQIAGVPNIIPTIFGSVIAGRSAKTSLNLDNGIKTLVCTQLDHSQEFDLEKFWRLEEISNEPTLSIEDQRAEEMFASTHKRFPDGRYMVNLPFKCDKNVDFGNSFAMSFRRLHSIERRFLSNSALKEQYHKFMDDYLSLGHMEEIPAAEIFSPSYKSFYLPHHAVFKEDSSTTKVRVVFDGSAKTNQSICLNDSLLVGPSIQRDIFSVCLRFRRHLYTISGDIEKMYRQIRVSRDHCDYQRILWRKTPEEPVKHYRLLTVTYGTACAPFLAVRTLKQLALDSSEKYPLASETVLNDFYVDDVITGADTIEEVIDLQKQLVELLKTGGFNLRKWTTNCWPLLMSIPEDQREMSPVQFEDCDSVKVLGLQWCPAKDRFSYKVKFSEAAVCTKRRILSDASRIFDPMGFLAPIVVAVKILLQDLWREKLNWDEELPKELADRWMTIRQELPLIEDLQMPRIIWTNKNNYEFHGFCDASLDAYSAVVYCRSKNEDGTFSVALVAAKSKVSPIKVLSLPRLELCGALLLTRLINKLKVSLQDKEMKVFAWTDSSIVLHWLSSPPKKWSVFIGNRTSEIVSSIPPKLWNHVRSESNPADCATRGISPSLLPSNELWWKGPSWLWQEKEQWPYSNPCNKEFSSEQLEERRNPKMQVLVSNAIDKNVLQTILNNSSKWYKCIRIVATMFRFRFNCRVPKEDSLLRNYQPLCVQELLKAKITLIRYSQMTVFSSEIRALQTGKELSQKHKILSLAPFIDSDGLLRVGGRVQNSELSYDEKHPIILCKSNRLSELIVDYIHGQYLHAGVTLMIALIKKEFYILGCRNLVRKIVHDCVPCFRQRRDSSKQLMGNLPIERIRFSRPFSKVGCDYAGPITLRLSRGRNPKFVKSYIALFVCFVTKGIHLELVGDLSSNAFLLALDRFCSRRGKPTEIWSDNGTNFHGAKRKLNEMFEGIMSEQHQRIVIDHLAKDSISWKFLPPSAPHFGGLWEAGVKSVKQHLKRVIGEHILTYEEMYTLLTKIEALLNSRPMWQTSDTEPSALSPSHFMIGEAYTSIPHPSVKLYQGFWKRWHEEYLTSLQQRTKWQKPQPNLSVNDVVLLKEPNLPPSKWILGRIIAAYPGEDDKVRVVTVRTVNGEYTRPVVKVAPLPFSERPEPFRGG